MERTRKIAIWWAAVVAVLVLAGAAVLVFVLTRPADQPAAAGPDACSDPGPAQVLIYFGRDAEMREAAKKLRDDDQIAALDTETKAEAARRFKEIFADEPELVDLVSPAALPAALWVLPADGVSSEELTTRLTDELSAADQVLVRPCPLPTTAPPAPPTEPS